MHSKKDPQRPERLHANQHRMEDALRIELLEEASSYKAHIIVGKLLAQGFTKLKPMKTSLKAYKLATNYDLRT